MRDLLGSMRKRRNAGLFDVNANAFATGADGYATASATGHSRTAPCGAGDDLVSVFERYDGCEPLLRPVDHATVTLPRDPLQTRLNEKKDETANPELDDRPAVPADGVERGGRGTAAQRERGARH